MEGAWRSIEDSAELNSDPGGQLKVSGPHPAHLRMLTSLELSQDAGRLLPAWLVLSACLHQWGHWLMQTSR